MSSNMTIQLFALEIGISIDYLIQQFLNVGIRKTKLDFVSQQEKDILIKYMKNNNTLSVRQFSLRRKTRSTLNMLGSGGRNKQVYIEVRKQQTYIVPCSDFKCGTKLKNNEDECTQKNPSNNQLVSEVLNKTKKISDNKQKTEFDSSIAKSLKKIKFTSDSSNFSNELNTQSKTLYKIHDKLQNHINKKQQSNKIKDSYFHKNPENQERFFNKKNFNCLNKLNSSVESIMDHENDLQMNYVHRNHSKIRSKSKRIVKSLKQKKNNFDFHALSDQNKLNEEKNLYVLKGVNQNHSKKSTLIQDFNKPNQMVSRNIVIGETISVLELSNKMSVKSSYMIKFMMQLGLMVTINQILDQETAQLVIEEMGHNVILRKKKKLEESLIYKHHTNSIHNISENSQNIINNDKIIYKDRAPVVTIMGHVDHGKTTLLDRIRSTKVVSSEVGGITQNIGAYRVTTKDGEIITFLDTPGHEAFMNMRIRGAKLTDIVILVIAADDGVMPQTIESIKHIQSSNIPVIIAINKIDKISTNVNHIKQELNHYGFIPEDWGGNIQFINVSAISGIGINDLLDAILLQSTTLQLKTAHHGMPAASVVIEASLDKKKGPVIIVLIKEGELKCGDFVLCGSEYGRVKAIRDEYGCQIESAYPSMPVEVLGLSGIPNAGDEMVVIHDEKKAREIALYRKDKQREVKLSRNQDKFNVDKETVFSRFNKNNDLKTIELNFIIKSDTQGSLEAICESLKKMETDKITIKIILSSIGNITETDSVLASTANATILGFNVKTDVSARHVIDLHNLNIHYYSIIYDLLNFVQKMIIDVTKSTIESETSVIGSAEIHDIFNSPKYGKIAGCIVIEGVIKLKKRIIIVRNNIKIHIGELESLRRFKCNVDEVKVGMECGIAIKNYCNFQPGDVIKVLN